MIVVVYYHNVTCQRSSEMRYLWRAVEGEVLESYASKTRDKAAAPSFIKKALRRQGAAERDHR